MINGKKCKILWHVNNLKISHLDAYVMEDIVTKLNTKYGKETLLSVQRGRVHEYLEMTTDYNIHGKVLFKMDEYVDRLLDEAPEDTNEKVATPASNNLFTVNDS